MIIKNGEVYNADFQFEFADLYIYDGVIVSDKKLAEEDGLVIDATDKYVLPGLVDIHSHGAVGHDFCDADVHGLEAILKYEKSCGVTNYCPTSMTYSYDILKDIFASACEVSADKEYADIAGINMEGPFISSEKRGAQNKNYIQSPNIDMFKKLDEICKNKIKLITIAPETESAIDFIENLKDVVNISVGHTNADYDKALEAFDKGASHVTHLCNAMPPFHHRDTGVIGAAFDRQDVFVEIICDGLHIHPSMIRSLFKLFGPDRICLISDSMEATGMPDGEYELGGQKVIKKGKSATLLDGTLAGSASNLFDCTKNAISFGIPIEDAIKSATATPAKSIGLYPSIGSLCEGSSGGILIVSKSFDLEYVL